MTRWSPRSCARRDITGTHERGAASRIIREGAGEQRVGVAGKAGTITVAQPGGYAGRSARAERMRSTRGCRRVLPTLWHRRRRSGVAVPGRGPPASPSGCAMRELSTFPPSKHEIGIERSQFATTATRRQRADRCRTARGDRGPRPTALVVDDDVLGGRLAITGRTCAVAAHSEGTRARRPSAGVHTAATRPGPQLTQARFIIGSGVPFDSTPGSSATRAQGALGRSSCAAKSRGCAASERMRVDDRVGRSPPQWAGDTVDTSRRRRRHPSPLADVDVDALWGREVSRPRRSAIPCGCRRSLPHLSTSASQAVVPDTDAARSAPSTSKRA